MARKGAAMKNVTRTVNCGRLFLTLSVLAALALFSAPAQAKPPVTVSCGQTLTHSVKLANDLTNCPDDGLVIGADNITVDLNGHTIDGVVGKTFDCEVGPGPEEPSGDGIQDDAGYDGVTIKGGTVQQFVNGVRSFGEPETVAMSDSRLHHLTLRDNRDEGMFIGGANRPPNNNLRIDHNLVLRNRNVCDFGFGIAVKASHSHIDHNRVEGSVDGFLVCCEGGTDRNVIEDNSVSHNHGYAFILVGFDDNRVEHNVLNGNDHGMVLDGSSGNDIRRNSISHGAGSSIDLVGGAAGNRVERNLLTDNGDGVTADTGAHDNLISRNTITGTGFFGFPEAGGFGIILDGIDDNTVERNLVVGGRGEAILVTSFDPQQTSDRNLVSRNVANSKLSDGILVNAHATATLLERNTADRSGDDGIDVDAAGTKLTRNTANHNHDLGIEAVPGVTDGGGNKAAGNGNPLQCTNVFCN
jgi:parallel beta-helix repeat protein